MHRPMRVSVLVALLAATAGMGAAQGASIYTCVDAKGRRLTSDRPIAECADREQRELNASGSVRRTVAPIPTAGERAAHEEAQRRMAEERQRQEEDKRMQRALLTRYPSQAAHDAERAKALSAAQDIIAVAQRRIADLGNERKALDTESEFYKTPAQWPAKLKRQFEDNEQQATAQHRQVARQQEEKRRIDRRFDEELARLKTLWAARQATAAAALAPVQMPAQR